MINPHDNYWIPSAGYKYLTNGVAYSDGIYLGVHDSIENWRDTNEEPPEPEPEQAAEEALTRYSNELTGATDETLVEAAETLIKIVKGES